MTPNRRQSLLPQGWWGALRERRPWRIPKPSVPQRDPRPPLKGVGRGRGGDGLCKYLSRQYLIRELGADPTGAGWETVPGTQYISVRPQEIGVCEGGFLITGL